MATSRAPRTDRLETRLRAEGQVRLIPYLMAGFPDAAGSIEIGRRMAAEGPGAIELGIPFSDPIGDGATIQRAGQQALAAGMTVRGALEVAAIIAREGVPVVLMTYVNPLLAHDPRRFAADAAQAGAAGVIVPDLPVEESEPIAGWLHSAGLDTIFMVAPTSPEARIAAACDASSGFVYCVTVTGVTGARAEVTTGLNPLLARVRRATSLPIAAGFGISTPDHIRTLLGRADAAVVGAALVNEIHEGRDPAMLLRTLVQACR